MISKVFVVAAVVVAIKRSVLVEKIASVSVIAKNEIEIVDVVVDGDLGHSV